MNLRRWSFVAVVLAVLAFGGLLTARGLGEGDDADDHPGFQFALIGDARYTEVERVEFVRLMESINGEDLAFTVHIGDIKGGGACTDDVYVETRALFDQFSAPLVYTPGDNDWTDCGRPPPLDRLAFLRRLFFSTEESQGRRRLRVLRQSAHFPENARWSHGQVTFATLHVVGSNNNQPDPTEPEGTRGDAREYASRNAANLDWLAQTFATARAERSRAVVLLMHADPAFARPPEQRGGFADLLDALERETVVFGKPVVLVHGDSHIGRVDKPMTDRSTGRTVANFTRVEVFGSPDVHWVRASVDPDDPGVLTFDQELVPGNRS